MEDSSIVYIHETLVWALFLVAAGRTGVLAQDAVVISGTVTTRADGLAVSGAVVALVGSELSVTTDAAGRYSLPAPAATRTAALQRRAHRDRFGVGAQDIFDAFPDDNSAVNSFNGIQTFPSQSPFGMNGRTVYARIRWEP